MNIKKTCRLLVEESFDFAIDVVLRVNTFYGQGHPHLVKLYKHVATEALDELINSTMSFVEKILNNESTIIFTMNDYGTHTLEKMNAPLAEVK